MLRKLLGRVGRWLASFDAQPVVSASVPMYWVGITTYEGSDREAASAAFTELQAQQHTLPGEREWMQGNVHVRTFKVV